MCHAQGTIALKSLFGASALPAFAIAIGDKGGELVFELMAIAVLTQ